MSGGFFTSVSSTALNRKDDVDLNGESNFPVNNSEFESYLFRERKKKIEKVIRKSRSRSVSPIIFRGRNTAMDAQEALARR